MTRFLKRLVKLAIFVALANVVLQLARRAMSEKHRYEPPIEPAWPAPKVDEAPLSTDPPRSAIGADEPEPASAERAEVPASSVAAQAEAASPSVAAQADPASTSSATAWVAPEAGECPHGYPVKVKVASGIYHLPGGLAYDRTKPDRCYATPQAAEADGYRAAKR